MRWRWFAGSVGSGDSGAFAVVSAINAKTRQLEILFLQSTRTHFGLLP
jgi:hypothetical protein